MSYSVPVLAGEEPVDARGGTDQWPRWEVFVRQRGALAHVHSESVHAPDAEEALQLARDVYTRRVEGTSLWVVPTAEVVAWEPEAAEADRSADEVDAEPRSWEVFVRHRRGLAHLHAGSLWARGAGEALWRAREALVPDREGVSVWAFPSAAISAADPDDVDAFFEPFSWKRYRLATYYDIPEEVGHM